jgi:hypothetical protein
LKQISIHINISALAILLVMAACSSPRKTTGTANSSPRVTRQDLMKGGTSFDDPIVLRVKTESAGIKEEYRWLAQSYPGYSLVRKTRASQGGKHYDLITFRTKNGEEKLAYFDITSFFGK